MLQRNTVILFVFFLILLVVVIFIEQRNDSKLDAELVSTDSPTQYLFDSNTEPVTRLRVDSFDGKLVELELDSEGVWNSKIPPASSDSIDQARIEPVINQLSFIRVVNDLENLLEMEVLGLDEPNYVITITREPSETNEIHIGHESPTGTGYYVKVNGDKPLLVDKPAIDRLISLLDDPPIIPSEAISTTIGITPTLGIAPTNSP